MRYFPTLEINDPLAREIWPRSAYQHTTDGFRVTEKAIDIDRIRHIRTAEDATRYYAPHVARLNAEYATGRELFRASFVMEG
jgi:hypothetical protein